MIIFEISTFAFITYCLGSVNPFWAYAFGACMFYQLVHAVAKAFRDAKFIKDASDAFDAEKSKNAVDELMGRNSDGS